MCVPLPPSFVVVSPLAYIPLVVFSEDAGGFARSVILVLFYKDGTYLPNTFNLSRV